MIIIDPPTHYAWRKQRWSHLASTESNTELHEFAARVELAFQWFHRDHYDIRERDYERMKEEGAVPVTRRKLATTRARRPGEEE